jgi:hypothetical protein
MQADKSKDDLEETKRIMSRLVKMPHKPHKPLKKKRPKRRAEKKS